MMMYMPPNIDVVSLPETAYCIATAAARFNLPPESLLGLALVEGGKTGTVSRNAKGSSDLGVMQVNTVWLTQASPLKPYISYEMLKMDVCTNVHAAAWILASNVKDAGGDLWRAIGMYHHPSNANLAQIYRVKVNNILPLAREIMAQVPEYSRFIAQAFNLASPHHAYPGTGTGTGTGRVGLSSANDILYAHQPRSID